MENIFLRVSVRLRRTSQLNLTEKQEQGGLFEYVL